MRRILYDHEKDPYQLDPLIMKERPQSELLMALEGELQSWLDRTQDKFDLSR